MSSPLYQVFCSANCGRVWEQVGDYAERAVADAHADLCDGLYWLPTTVIEIAPAQSPCTSCQGKGRLPHTCPSSAVVYYVCPECAGSGVDGGEH